MTSPRCLTLCALIIALAATGGPAMTQETAPYTATILSKKVICKQPDRYIGWPTICKTEDGALLVVFSGDRDEHVCPWGKTQIVRSTDNGESWSEPSTINNTPLDDRDAGIIQTKRGTLLVAWFTSLAFLDMPQAKTDWLRHAEKLGPETRAQWLGNWTRRSTDGGQTWEDPVRTLCSAPHGPIQLRDGRLLYVGTARKDGQKVIGVEVSEDDGQSWTTISTVPLGGQDMGQLHEPHVAEMPDGRLVTLVRYQPADGQCYLQQSESADGGRTWTTLHGTPMWGYPPHLIVLRNGWLLTVYGRRKEPFGEMACISRDGGNTWDIEHEITLAQAPNSDLGYPASVQLDDGSIWTVYYQIDQPGEKTCLMGTHWRLEGEGL
jgi:sialidase-1